MPDDPKNPGSLGDDRTLPGQNHSPAQPDQMKYHPPVDSSARLFPAPTDLEPLGHEFVCPACGFTDKGNFCSDCGGSLRIEKEEVLLLAVARLKAIGYVDLADVDAEQVGCTPELLEALQLPSLAPAGVHCLVIPHFGHGMNFELLLLAEHDDLDAEEIASRMQAFFDLHKSRFTEQQRQSKNRFDWVEQVNVRVVVWMKNIGGFPEDEAHLKSLLAQKGKRKFRSRGPARFLSLGRGFTGAVRWETNVIDYDHGRLRSTKTRPTDAVRNQLELAIRQASAESAQDSRKANMALNVVRAPLARLWSYFAILGAFLSNRYGYAGSIVRRRTLSIEKVISLYVIGIGVSVLLPTALTWGALTPDKLLAFGQYSPIIDHTAQLALDVFEIGVLSLLLLVGMWVCGNRGRYSDVFLAMLFVHAYFQIFDRTFFYFVAMIPPENQGGVRFLGSIRWFFYAYFLLPFMSTVFRASRHQIDIVYTVSYVLMFVGLTSIPYLFPATQALIEPPPVAGPSTPMDGATPTTDPEKANAVFTRGLEQSERQEWDAAIASFSSAITLDPDLADAYYQRALVNHTGKGRPDLAIADYSKTIQLVSDNPEPYLLRGNAYNEIGANEKALADYDKSIQLDSSSPVAYHDRALAQGALGNADEAIANFNRAIQLAPEFASAFKYRGLLFLELGQPQNAFDDFDKCSQLTPSDPVAYYNRGFALSVMNQDEKAVANYTRAIEMSPGNPDFYVGRAGSLHRLGEYNKMIADGEQLIELDRSSPLGYFFKGLGLLGKTEYELAIEAFTRAIKRTPDFAASYYWRGVSHRERGDADKAAGDFARARELGFELPGDE